jgi:hypothetical protein
LDPKQHKRGKQEKKKKKGVGEVWLLLTFLTKNVSSSFVSK